MKRIFLLALAFLCATNLLQAQMVQRYQIALFAPLYLDSVFDGSSYRFGKEFPKFINPGLEFYEGAQWALDSLQKKGAPLDVFVYDSRSRRKSLTQQLNSPEMAGVDMIIANANFQEVRTLAQAAQTKKVPFISATLPNDAGISSNPYMVILNSTLRAHCEGIYRYVQANHSNDRIVLFRKPGAQENQLQEYFNEIAQQTVATKVKMEVIDVTKGFDVTSWSRRLDSTRRTVAIAGSLSESFGTDLAAQLAEISGTYPITLIGMPTWDGMREFSKSAYNNLEIIYSTPFYYNRNGSLASQITQEFEEKIESRPTDMFYRGYETVLRFALLLLDTQKDVASNLTRKGNYVFTQFDIQPVFLNKANMTLDYFENKKLYFIRRQNGNVDVINHPF